MSTTAHLNSTSPVVPQMLSAHCAGVSAAGSSAGSNERVAERARGRAGHLQQGMGISVEATAVLGGR